MFHSKQFACHAYFELAAYLKIAKVFLLLLNILNVFCLSFKEFSLHFSIIVDELITRSWIRFTFFPAHHKVISLVFPSIRQYRLRFYVDRIIARHSTCKLEKFIPDICAMHTFAYWLADRYSHLKDVDARSRHAETHFVLKCFKYHTEIACYRNVSTISHIVWNHSIC